MILVLVLVEMQGWNIGIVSGTIVSGQHYVHNEIEEKIDFQRNHKTAALLRQDFLGE